MNIEDISEHSKLGDLLFSKTWLCKDESLNCKTMKCFALKHGKSLDDHYVDYQPFTEDENLLNNVNPLFLIGEGYLFFYHRMAFFLDFNEAFMVQIESTGTIRNKIDLDFKLKNAWQVLECGFDLGTKFGIDYANHQ